MYKKVVKIVSGIIITGIFLLFVLSFFDNRQKVTDIAKYEKYLGAEGKYKEHFNTYNDIFPDAIPPNAEVSDFIYYYYNPWDPCYMGYLVYRCDEDVYTKEYERLKALSSSEDIYIYGATDFPYELCAVYADEYYGYIYSLADKENSQLIYVELRFCNGFTDIDYEKYIPKDHLPKGFSAKKEDSMRKN